MSMSSSRPFAGPSYPTSPSPTTASSLNYSQYGSTSFASPSGNLTASVSSSSYGAPLTRTGGPAPVRNGGLKPPSSVGGERRMESRDVASVHWRALREFLRSWLEKESPSSRASAREKLTRLTKLQFQELSTDVYDELMRRINVDNGSSEGAVPFLPVRDDFHPKRNQARQKLATLPKNRFKDLASDVFHELRRRYPEFDEQDAMEPTYDDEPPHAPGPVPIRPQYPQNPSQPYPQNFSQSSFPLNSAQSSLRDRARDDPTPPPMNRLASATSQHQRQGSRNISGSSSFGENTQHRTRPSRDRDISNETNGYGDRDQQQPSSTAATSEIVVPNKSRLREEEIEVPYARDSQLMETQRTSSRAESRSSIGRESLTSSIPDRARTPRDRRGDPMETLSPSATDDRDYYDRMSFSSNLTSKSKAGQLVGWDEDREQKIRAEYEFRIAGLERRTAMAEAHREEAKRSEAAERDKRKEWEDEVRGLKERSATHASSLRSIQHELDVARDAAETARKHSEQTSRSAQEEIGQWRDRCDGLEDEIRRLEDGKAASDDLNGVGDNDQAVGELKGEIHSLVDELNALSLRNDEIMTEREQDAATMNDMEARVEEYKRKYDAVRIELRNLKATSTMFVSKPVTDDHLPASADGNIADVNVSSFQSAIDGLLAAARSSTPSGVLPAMKAVVEAITEIGEDVKAFEARPNLDVDVSRLESLKHESTARLNNLMQAARNHAMASGLSPVSLLDAAAGHLSANVVDIIKLLKIRRSAQSRDMRRRGSNLSIKEMVNRTDAKTANGNWDREYGAEERLKESPVAAKRLNETLLPKPISRTGTPIESRADGNISSAPSAPPPTFRINSFQSSSSGHRSDSFDLERKASVASERRAPVRPVIETRNINGNVYSRTSVTSATSGSSAVAPATAYESPWNGRSVEVEDDDDLGEGGDEQEWEDLKPYLNTQSSALVNSIQNLLAAIRTGGQGPALNEHLSEVIAIASSIVAVSTNSLPSSLRPEGNVLLRDLVNNTNKLSEAQESAKMGGGAQFEKNVRQQIASASFGVAKSLKALMKLGTE